MKTDAVAKTGSAALARPEYIKESTAGHENIRSKDIKPPALKIAQSSSPETKRSEKDKYVEGLVEGMFFNSLTKEIYGEDPINVVVILPIGVRYTEFDKDGKVVTFNVAEEDPKTSWTDVVVDGQTVRTKPKATKFWDFLVLALLPGDRRQLMTMSLKSTQLKKADFIVNIIGQSKLPSYAFQFTAAPVPENGNGKSWYGWRFTQTWPTEEVYLEAEAFYQQVMGKKDGVKKAVVIDVDQPSAAVHDDDIPF